MALKHRVSINITGVGGQGKNIIAGAERRLGRPIFMLERK